MEVLTYNDFKNNLAETLDKVNDDAQTVIIARSKGKSVVIMGLDEYNSIMETLYITKSGANAKRLQEAIDEMNSGISYVHTLLD